MVKKIAFLSVLISIMILVFSVGEAKRVYVFETTSDVKVKLSDPRPVIIHGDGEEVTAQALVETGNYKKSISFKDV
ncbi:hypothetical protein KGY79_12285, partial [Candidatus Bipolaricaulota bacterium]|nr:hypothetical protein [Candidatus Bipolaricaulota bacterium]